MGASGQQKTNVDVSQKLLSIGIGVRNVWNPSCMCLCSEPEQSKALRQGSDSYCSSWGCDILPQVQQQDSHTVVHTSMVNTCGIYFVDHCSCITTSYSGITIVYVI